MMDRAKIEMRIIVPWKTPENFGYIVELNPDVGEIIDKIKYLKEKLILVNTMVEEQMLLMDIQKAEERKTDICSYIGKSIAYNIIDTLEKKS